MTFRRRTLPGLDVSLLDCTGHAFPKHSHDEFVIGANLSGRERVWLDGCSIDVETDQVTLYNPGQVQAGDAGGTPWSFVSVHVEPRTVDRLLNAEAGAGFDRPTIGAAPVAAAVRRFGMRALDPAVSDAEIVETATMLLGTLFAVARGIRSKAHPLLGEARARRVADRLRSAPASSPSLEELASEEGMSPVQLVRAFARVHGLPPFAWLTVERLKEARRRLRGTEAIADIAADLGFADQAHLTRRFKAMYGVPPGTWRAGEITFKTAAAPVG